MGVVWISYTRVCTQKTRFSTLTIKLTFVLHPAAVYYLSSLLRPES